MLVYLMLVAARQDRRHGMGSVPRIAFCERIIRVPTETDKCSLLVAFLNIFSHLIKRNAVNIKIIIFVKPGKIPGINGRIVPARYFYVAVSRHILPPHAVS